MQIAGREISNEFPPYIVAEISGNHAGNFYKALDLICAAKDAGADAVKLQCYTPDTITIDCDKPDFILKDGPWKGRKLYELYQSAHTPWDWFPELFDHARAVGIAIFSSVFDPTSVDFLERLGCPAYKIASMEITDIPLIKYVANTGKPFIVSTGMASEDDILTIWGMYGDHKFAFLHCISGYPTPIEEANLLAIREWNRRLGVCLGISDHTHGCDVAVAATALGATIIEKHLCLRGVTSEDSDFSMQPDEFQLMCIKVRRIWRAMQPSERKSEESSRQARRSLYVVKDVRVGERFTIENVRSIRPAYGMPPKDLSQVLISHAACNIERGTALESWMLMPF